MYISELELQGFKSFAYKTKVKFDSGITAIVGPNGCGKSNIVDAMRWVLGEQRPTLLRSSSMSNVIFNGTAQKNALGMAEVSLTFVNNKGLLPTEYSEVTIGRRLYRSGDSEYLINGTTCRLKDINDLFMDTGMGSDAYSVIELKMVEEILDDKNNDRRHLFEEAAGVTRYKEKRRKTFRKLEETRSDLQRIEDILSEVRKQTRSLENQAEKAAKAKRYREELEHLDKALHRFQYLNIQDELEPLEERIANAEKEKKEIQNKVEELEEAGESTREALNQKERNQAEAQRRVSQLHNRIRDADTERQITKEKISNEQGVIEQYTRDIEQGEQDLEELREIFESTRNKLESIDEELRKAKNNLSSAEERYTEVQQSYTEERGKLGELEEEQNRANRALGDLRDTQIRIESRIENAEEDLARIAKEIEDLEDEIAALKSERDSLQEELEQAAAARDKRKEALRSAREERRQLAEQREDLRDRIRSRRSRLSSIQNEITLLREIADSNEAVPGSVRFLLENFGDRFELLEVVSNLFSTDEAHAVALENVLGDALNYVVVQSLSDARQAASILKKHDEGRATFIPIDRLTGEYEVDERSIYHKVTSDQAFDRLKRLLLGNVLIVDSIEDGYETIRGTSKVGVTLDGEVVTSQPFLQSGSKGKNAGIRVGLEDKIENLEGKAGEVTFEIRKNEKKLEEATRAMESIDLEQREEEVNEAVLRVRQIENRINSAESKIQIYEKNVAELRNRREERSGSEDSAREQLKEIEPRRRELKQQIEELEQKQQEKQQVLNELEEERNIAQSRYNDAQLKHQDLENKFENYEREIKRAEAGISSIKDRLNHRSERKEEAKSQIEKYRSRIEELEEELQVAREEKEEADQALSEAEEASSKQRGRINEIEKELKEVRRQKEVNMELVHHLEMAKEKMELQAENLTDHIWETYGILMKQIDAEMPDDKEPEEVRERIAWLKQKLNQIGEVNPLAIEEYEEEKERLEFYEEHIADLQKAEEELRETIDEINKTATERFDVTFEKIRINFKKVFHTLFDEDDYCDLVIEEDAEDPLEAKIEIKANPRGKRPASINQLSGGEKTLTAIALLFAIYLVKPSPFCVLDEVDAPLDDANIERFVGMIREFSEETQFIIITHNKMTMSKAEMMYGITMPETGISRLVGVKLDEVTTK
ncbi:MAG: chromosome segregation protein SMC [Balneolaceae bacterium]|nr:chromosome segregation protein SMC [Balneolaceae bacterium]